MISLLSRRRLNGLLAACALGLAACTEPTSGLRPVIAVTITPALIEIASGTDTALAATVIGNNAQPLEGRTVAWSSSNTAIATVTESGVVSAGIITGGAAGVVTITASSGGRNGTATVSVLPSEPVSLTLDVTSAALADGDQLQLMATLRDAANNILTGRTVLWTSLDTTVARVTAGGVLLPAGFLDAGPRETQVVASIGELADTLTVTVQPTTAASLDLTPDAVFLAIGSTRRFRAQLRSEFGTPIYGEPVIWSSTASNIADVDTEGLVTAAREGDTQISANSGGFEAIASVIVNSCGAGPPGAYSIEIRYNAGTPSAAVQQAFECAVAKIRAVVVGALPSVNFSNFNASECVTGLTINETISGLVIFSTIEAIDGPGGVLGSAGPCYIRNESSLSVVGRMRFDSADLENLAAQGGLGTVITHEMLHVVGIGTLWGVKQLLEGVGSTPRFLGQLARAACVNDMDGAEACATYVPVEDCLGLPSGSNCGAGTINSHWKESVFQTELMTGFLNSGLNPFSRMSVQSLADLGYTVDVGAADDFSLQPALMAPLGTPTFAPIRMPDPTRPTHRVDRWGNATPIPHF